MRLIHQGRCLPGVPRDRLTAATQVVTRSLEFAEMTRCTTHVAQLVSKTSDYFHQIHIYRSLLMETLADRKFRSRRSFFEGYQNLMKLKLFRETLWLSVTGTTRKEAMARTIWPPPNVTDHPEAKPKNIPKKKKTTGPKNRVREKPNHLQGRQTQTDRINTIYVPTIVMELVKIGKIEVGLLCLQMNYHLFRRCI